MLNQARNLKRLVFRIALLSLLCVVLSGCAKWNLRGDGLSDWQQSSFPELRPGSPTKDDSVFMSKTAQDISDRFKR